MKKILSQTKSDGIAAKRKSDPEVSLLTFSAALVRSHDALTRQLKVEHSEIVYWAALEEKMEEERDGLLLALRAALEYIEDVAELPLGDDWRDRFLALHPLALAALKAQKSPAVIE